MIKIALITEGVTDQFIIKPIIKNYFKDREFVFRPIVPNVDETDKQTSFGGWVNVVNECKGSNISDLFNYNDFVVIQIDADISQEKGFDVPHSENGKQIGNEKLCENIIRKLQSFFPLGIWEEYADRLLFAIGIYSMECWLVALVNSRHTNKDIQNCLHRLNGGLSKNNIKIINPKDKNCFQSRSTYRYLANQFKNKKIIDKLAKRNAGFECFIEQISNMGIVDN